MKIVVLAGGRSTERNVSLSSGTKISNALRSKGHRVALVDLFLGQELASDADVDDLFTTEPGDDSKLNISDEILNDDKINALRPDHGAKGLFGPNVLTICQAADIVYLGLHGEDGENGKVQAVLDLFNIHYTGSDTLASGLAMNKKYSKEIFIQNHIPTAAYIATKTSQVTAEQIPFGFPVVVKPASGGSSVGTHIVPTADQLQAALADALSFDEEALIEEYIKGREFSIALLDGAALPAVEIVVKKGWYDFEHKFQANDDTQLISPPDIDDQLHQEMQALALQAFNALGMQNYGRVDFLVREGQPYAIEANSLPGMTPLSLIPQEARAAGIEYADLCERIIESKVRFYQKQQA